LEAQENKLPKIYLCDPSKNKECDKTFCFINGGDCNMTQKKECKVDGSPLIVFIDKEATIKQAFEALDWLKRMADRWTMHQNDFYEQKTKEAYDTLESFIYTKGGN